MLFTKRMFLIHLFQPIAIVLPLPSTLVLYVPTIYPMTRVHFDEDSDSDAFDDEEQDPADDGGVVYEAFL